MYNSYNTGDPVADAERWYCDQEHEEDEEEWDDLGEDLAWERYRE